MTAKYQEQFRVKCRKMSTERLEALRAKRASECMLWEQFAINHILRIRDRKGQGKCIARIHHGAGHQSSTWCDVRGPHRIHHAIYGEFDQEMEWRGLEAYSGFFDEPKELK